MVAIICKNDCNETKGSGFYKQLMVLKQKFSGYNATNYCIIRRMYVDSCY